MRTLDAGEAALFARVALGHVTREYPHKLDHVLVSAEDARTPRQLHPIFYGSFDWHSCVHSYWLLASLYRRFVLPPDVAAAIRETIDAHFTEVNVRAEVAYLERPSSRTFERPYGWAWLLSLSAELARATSDEGLRWHRTLLPLADAFAARFMAHLPQATYPIRAGTHGNSAFALALAYEWAVQLKDDPLRRLLVEKATDWFENDSDCDVWEPGGDDFLSPALVEAECMRRVLGPRAFLPWLARFLPGLEIGAPTTLFVPASVTNRSDGKLAHLDGLNLSRAWCLRRILATLPPGDPRRTRIGAAIDAHLEASLPHVTGDYMGEHWLATYAVLALADEE